MAKIFILLGRRSSGKTTTIDKAAKKLDLERKPQKYASHGFIEWAGFAQEVSSKKQVEVFAERSSPQEQEYESADLNGSIEEVKKYADKWVKFLSDKESAIAIIPFTLCGTRHTDVIPMVMEPLKIFEQSNSVEIIYLEWKYHTKLFVQQLINDLTNQKKIKLIIHSNEEYERQAKELLDYIGLVKVE